MTIAFLLSKLHGRIHLHLIATKNLRAAYAEKKYRRWEHSLPQHHRVDIVICFLKEPKLACHLESLNHNSTPVKMDLPAYHEIDQLSPPISTSNHSSNQLAEPNDSTDAEFFLIGGSGVRVPLTPDDRGSYDRRVILHLSRYGTIERHNMNYPPNSAQRM